MSKELSNLKKGADIFYKKVASHMDSIKIANGHKDKREKKSINDWFYGKIERSAEYE